MSKLPRQHLSRQLDGRGTRGASRWVACSRIDCWPAVCSLQSAVCGSSSGPVRGGEGSRGGLSRGGHSCGSNRAGPLNRVLILLHISRPQLGLSLSTLSQPAPAAQAAQAAHIKHATNAAPPRPDWNRRQIAEEGGASPTLVDVQEQPLCSQSALPRRFGAANAKASGVAFLLARRGIGWTLDRWQQLATNQTRGPGPPFKALDAASPPVSRP